MKIKIFKYIDQLDCFTVIPTYKDISKKLGLTEWNEVNWIGRYFLLDNDFGEHWFDNWDLRDSVEKKASEIVFWTDVLKSLELSLELIFNEAKEFNEKREKDDSNYIDNLGERIDQIKNAL